MPTYEYRCDNGHVFEVFQRMTDDPVEVCPECGATVQRVFHPVAVHFKGSGFYTTDYGKKKSAAATDSKPESKTETSKTETSKTETSKTETSKTETSSSD